MLPEERPPNIPQSVSVNSFSSNLTSKTENDFPNIVSEVAATKIQGDIEISHWEGMGKYA